MSDSDVEPESKKICLKYNGKSKRSLLNFTHAKPLEESKFQMNEFEKSDSRIIEVSSSILDASYLGFNKVNDKNVGMKYYLAEYDSDTGVAEVFDTEFFEMQPFISKLIPNVAKELTMEEINEKNKKSKTPSLKRDELTTAFGSHKKKRALATKLRNNVADNSFQVQESVDAIIEKTDLVELNKDIEKSIARAESLLPFNPDATEAEDVYSLQKLVPITVSTSIVQISQAYINATQDDLKQFCIDGLPRYIITHIEKPPLKFSNDPKNYEQYAGCLQLIKFMVLIYRSRAAQIKSQAFMENEPANLRNWVISEFTVGEGRHRTLPQRLKDKALALAVVLSWHIDSFVGDCEMLREAFSISQKKFNSVVRALGGCCKITSKNNVRKEVFTLSLPLKFPKPMVVRSGKRKE